MEDDTFNTVIEKAGKSRHDQAATRIFSAKTILLLTLFASICGWLWLLGKGAIAIAEAITELLGG